MRKLPLLLLSLAIISCVQRENVYFSSGESESFDSLSAISQLITAIPLETNSQCILTEIKQVKTTKSDIFVRSGNDIYRFNYNGSFINKISIGDNTYLNKYAVDSDNQHIIMLDSLSMIHFFAYDGTPLYTKNTEATLSDHAVLDLAYHDHFLWVVTKKIAENNAIERWMYKLDLTYKPLEGTQLATVNLGRFYLDGISTSELYVADNKMYVYSPFFHKETILKDTMYLIASGQLNHNQLFPYSNNHDFPAYSIPLLLSKRYLLTSYQTNESESANYLFCYDTKTNKLFSMNGFKDDFYHTGIIKELLPLNPYNGDYYFCKSGNDLSVSFPEHDENSNPILFVVHLNG
jgi:hypothetical protein